MFQALQRGGKSEMEKVHLRLQPTHLTTYLLRLLYGNSLTWWSFNLNLSVLRERVFFLIEIFDNFIFWNTLFSELMPNFWRPIWKSAKSVKVSKSQIIFFSRTQKLHHWDRATLPVATTTKVRIFWEGHKILRNLHLTFVYSTYRQK